jgi:hypothetical protein
MSCKHNVTGLVELWMFPGGAANHSYPNLTIAQFWAVAGPSDAGRFTVEVLYSEMGCQIAVFHPSVTATVPYAQFELARTTC